MKAKLLKKIRRCFYIIHYWDDVKKESYYMSKNKETGKLSKTKDFLDFYSSVCWGYGLNTYFKLKGLYYTREENRRQRKLNKEFQILTH